MLEWPKWKKDLDVFHNMKNAFLIEGNVHDLQPWINEEEQSCSTKSLNEFLYEYLKKIGYDVVVFYNRIDGFFNKESENELKEFFRLSASKNGCCDLETASAAIRIATENPNVSVAVIFDLANIAVISSQVSEVESEVLARLLLASKNSVQAPSSITGAMLNNLVFYIVEKANDLPAWFYLNNPYIKTLTITKIGKELRENLIESHITAFCDYNELEFEERQKCVENLANLTEGFSTSDLYGLITLCMEKGFAIKDAKKAVDFYKFGQIESYWDKIDSEVIKNFAQILTKRVKGQEEAVNKAAEIVGRASMGLTGIQKGSGSRPKGILFLAGPTGTGKTEIAKSIAEQIFGDEDFITRFDMSEYQQPQSDQKLLGAPPGYVGYDAGGLLTNAVKEKPFNILLFDEIDKAHPSIFDKFLQILDDGRMTDSFGETVYFSESLIIFTSNLGMTKEAVGGGRCPNVTFDDEYPVVKERIMTAIKEFFIDIGRPEILNRIGSNIVVFNFIKDEKVVREIVDLQLGKIKKNIYDEKGVVIEYSEDYIQTLLGKVKLNLENGARGIGNKIEEFLVNLLPYVFIEHDIKGKCKIYIDSLSAENRLVVRVECIDNTVKQPSTDTAQDS